MARKKRRAPAGSVCRAKKRKVLPAPDEPCVFCDRSVDNERIFLKKISSRNITAHYFCLLFSSGLVQQGHENEGVMGFLPKDIMKEMKRGSKLRCIFCKKVGATVGCIVSKCRITYHYPCGLENDSLFQYFDMFKSFCCTHQPTQDIVWQIDSHVSDVTCSICMNEIDPNFGPKTFITPCCRKAWFHRLCLQEQAWAAGLHFCKCPLCSNKEIFQLELKRLGIYIPDRDAEWELEPNAFGELLKRHERCDVLNCLCPKGREFNGFDTEWELLLCDDCGSRGSHMSCAGMEAMTEEWVCDDCKKIDSRLATSARATNCHSAKHMGHKSNDPRKELEKKCQSSYPGPSGAMIKTKPAGSHRGGAASRGYRRGGGGHSGRKQSSVTSRPEPKKKRGRARGKNTTGRSRKLSSSSSQDDFLTTGYQSPRDIIINEGTNIVETADNWLQTIVKQETNPLASPRSDHENEDKVHSSLSLPLDYDSNDSDDEQQNIARINSLSAMKRRNMFFEGTHSSSPVNQNVASLSCDPEPSCSKDINNTTSCHSKHGINDGQSVPKIPEHSATIIIDSSSESQGNDSDHVSNVHTNNIDITVISSSSEDEDLKLVSVKFNKERQHERVCTCHLRHKIPSNERESAIDLTEDWKELHEYIEQRKRLDALKEGNSDLEIVSNDSDDPDLYVIENRGPITMYPIRPKHEPTHDHNSCAGSSPVDESNQGLNASIVPSVSNNQPGPTLEERNLSSTKMHNLTNNSPILNFTAESPLVVPHASPVKQMAIVQPYKESTEISPDATSDGCENDT